MEIFFKIWSKANALIYWLRPKIEQRDVNTKCSLMVDRRIITGWHDIGSQNRNSNYAIKDVEKKLLMFNWISPTKYRPWATVIQNSRFSFRTYTICVSLWLHNYIITAVEQLKCFMIYKCPACLQWSMQVAYKMTSTYEIFTHKFRADEVSRTQIRSVI